MGFSTYAGRLKGVKKEDLPAQPNHDSLFQVNPVSTICDYDIKRNGDKNKQLIGTL